MAESFGTKIEKKDLEKFMNPMGFIDEKDIKDYSSEKNPDKWNIDYQLLRDLYLGNKFPCNYKKL